jgi:peptidoglycan/LPS O-acetylase OafA/YrhL
MLALCMTSLILMMVRSPLAANTLPYDTLNGIAMIFTLFTSAYLVAMGAIGSFSTTGFCRPVRRGLIRLGNYSYTIYLIHFPVFVLGWMLINELFPFAFSHPLLYGLTQLVVVCLLLIPFVNFGYYHVELRSIALGEKLIQKLSLIPQKQDT